MLVENCTFGESHCVLTLGSECINAKNITLRHCKVESNTPILRLKMRPDTYQTFENITIDNITGKCGTIISINPWKQFFDMGGSTVKQFATVRNITLSNINVQCKSFGEMEGNAADIVNNIVLKNITATAEAPALKSKYPTIKAENVIVNGAPLLIQ